MKVVPLIAALVGCSEVELHYDKSSTTLPTTITSPTTPTTPTPTIDTATTTTTPTDTGTRTGTPEQQVLAPIRDAMVIENRPTTNYGERIELSCGAWTEGGVPYTVRGLVAFDLSGLPPDAFGIVATLDLYAETTSRMYGQGITNSLPPGHSNLSSSNAWRIRRTLDPWDELTVTWSNQPAADGNAVVQEPGTSLSDLDYLGIDVSGLVADALAAGDGEASFLLHLANESYYAEVTFGSGDHSDPALHPVLTLDYLVPGP
ncbi:MAG: DNRLRE domain-containing protein [Myxococcota bacterium]